jgi:hypothetical protein
LAFSFFAIYPFCFLYIPSGSFCRQSSARSWSAVDAAGGVQKLLVRFHFFEAGAAGVEARDGVAKALDQPGNFEELRVDRQPGFAMLGKQLRVKRMKEHAYLLLDNEEDAHGEADQNFDLKRTILEIEDRLDETDRSLKAVEIQIFCA